MTFQIGDLVKYTSSHLKDYVYVVSGVQGCRVTMYMLNEYDLVRREVPDEWLIRVPMTFAGPSKLGSP